MTEVSPAFDAFAAAHRRGEPQLVWLRIVDDLETPVSAFLKIGAGRRYSFLFESVEGGAWRGRYSIIALDPDQVWRCWSDRAELATAADGLDAFAPEPGGALDSLRRFVDAARLAIPPELPPMAAGVFGAIGYDMIRLVEPVGAAKPDGLGLPDAVMVRPQVVAVFDSIAQEILLITPVRPGVGAPAEARAAYDAAAARLEAVAQALRQTLDRAGPPARAPEPPPPPLASPVTREAYGGIVERARAYIAAGDVFQVVPSHRFSAPAPASPLAVYRSLRRTNPSPYMYFLDFGGFQLSGSSPEILVRYRDGRVTIRPIAGTRQRGATPEQDAALEAELRADPKERAEHLMLLDLGRNDVGRTVMLRDEGRNDPLPVRPRVRVTDSFFVERYSHVMHLVSNVEGDAPEGLDPVDVILTALPAGTLSGAPKVRAMQIIDELETDKRGLVYAGCAGYISSAGEVDCCILLRTALFKDGRMHVQAGGGVVADSDPDAEYEETLHKSNALRRAAAEAWRFEG